jgi:hypothetical protein
MEFVSKEFLDNALKVAQQEFQGWAWQDQTSGKGERSRHMTIRHFISDTIATATAVVVYTTSTCIWSIHQWPEDTAAFTPAGGDRLPDYRSHRSDHYASSSYRDSVPISDTRLYDLPRHYSGEGCADSGQGARRGHVVLSPRARRGDMTIRRILMVMRGRRDATYTTRKNTISDKKKLVTNKLKLVTNVV